MSSAAGIAITYEYQPGGLLDWGNVFYYGNDISDINNVDRNGTTGSTPRISKGHHQDLTFELPRLPDPRT
jgi:hypothetical protein